MKITRLLILVFAAVLSFSILSCSDKKKGTEFQEFGPTDFEKGLGGEDTLAVKQLLDQFFGYLENQKYADAVQMLYRCDESNNGEIEVLGNEDIEHYTRSFKVFPVVGYKINYMKFSEYNDNEVMVDVIMREAQGDEPAMTTKMNFKPINNMGEWVLTMRNSFYGDRNLVDPLKRDSVKKSYDAIKSPNPQPKKAED